MKKIVFSLILIMGAYHLIAQTTASPPYGNVNGNIEVSSPNAASFGTYGKVPVNLSTGQLNYSVLLEDFNINDIKVPIELSYSYQGFKPNDHPGWTGLGWNFQPGGVITRIKHGEPDERVLPIENDPDKDTIICGLQISYMASDHRFYLSGISPQTITSSAYNFLMKASISAKLDCSKAPINTQWFDAEPDEFLFNFNGHSGKFVFSNDYDKQFKVTTNSSDVFKIDYVFRRNLDVSSDVPMKVTNVIEKFIVKMYDGYTYEFGGDFTNNHDCELFVGYPEDLQSTQPRQRTSGMYMSAWYVSKITSPTGKVMTFQYDRDGYHAGLYPSVDLQQINDQSVGTSSRKTNYNTYSTPVNLTSYLKSIECGTKKVVFRRINTSRKIKGNTSTNWQDRYVKEEELPDYVNTIGIDLTNAMDNNLVKYHSAYGNMLMITDPTCKRTFDQFWQKLTDVEFYNNGQLTTAYKLDYYQKLYYNDTTVLSSPGGSATGRLELKSIRRKGIYGDYKPYYSFSYWGQYPAAPVSYIPYGTRKVDHWGYFNGIDHLKSTFPTIADTINLYVSEALGKAYATSRRSVHASSNIGGLYQITYPTGGTTKIYYQPNTVRKVVTFDSTINNFRIVDLGIDTPVGGFRVSQVVDNPNIAGTGTVFKQYYYTSAYGYTHGQESSGVLNSGFPVYYRKDYWYNFFRYFAPSAGPTNLIYASLSSDGFMPFYINCNPVTYSSVVERLGNNAYTVSEFTNSDNGSDYMDKLQGLRDTTGYLQNGLRFQWHYSREDERGKILSESYYTDQDVLVKKNEYVYNDASDRFSANPVNYLRKDLKQLAVNNFSYLIDNFRSYFGTYTTYHNYLKEKRVTDYLLTNSLTTTTAFKYDRYRNVICQTVSNTPTEELSSNYKYAADSDYTISGIPADSFAISVKHLRDSSLFALPVEVTSMIKKDGAAYVTNATLFRYHPTFPLLMSTSVLETASPLSNFVSSGISGRNFVSDSRYNLNKIQNVYANPGGNSLFLQTIRENGNDVTAIKDDQMMDAIASVRNATAKEAYYNSFEPNQNNYWFINNNSNIKDGDAVTGKRSFLLNGGGIVRTPLNSLENGKKYHVFYWVKSGTPVLNITPHNGIKTLLSVRGWQLMHATFTAANPQLEFTGTGMIDEIRIMPLGAVMQTYTYDLHHRMNSECSSSNIITNYEYDELNRLTITRDANGNIIKKTEYGLQVAD